MIVRRSKWSSKFTCIFKHHFQEFLDIFWKNLFSKTLIKCKDLVYTDLKSICFTSWVMAAGVHVWKAVYGQRAADWGGGGQKLYGSTAEAFKLIHLFF